jgi:hypothetical protein
VAAAADIAVAAEAVAVIDRLTICQFFSGAPDGAPYEMAFRMQTSVPDLMSTDDEPESTFEKYGPQSKKKGSFASNCILARRMAERGVRFVQLFHRGWDQYGNLPKEICRNTDGVVSRNTITTVYADLQSVGETGWSGFRFVNRRSRETRLRQWT